MGFLEVGRDSDVDDGRPRFTAQLLVEVFGFDGVVRVLRFSSSSGYELIVLAGGTARVAVFFGAVRVRGSALPRKRRI